MKRNGFIMRRAYPHGYHGDHVSFWRALGLALSNSWNEWCETSATAEKIFMFVVIVVGGILTVIALVIFLIALVLYELYHVVARGTVMAFDDSNDDKELKIPFLYRFLPAMWTVVALVGVYAVGSLGFFYVFHWEPEIKFSATGFFIAFIWMGFIWVKLDKPYNFLIARLKITAPTLAREMQFLALRQVGDDLKDGFLLFLSPLFWLVRKIKMEVRLTD
jgi:hypothetical protein